ncbi:MAG: transketolase [Candidatus Wildermuthbacteria bacterium RIFCSPHIGHO2_01_FULL_45_20]|uniref:Transketolase n=1 Tax=Candidatus Wildermuthbacteria bacterium RIFCSPHIGHO2_02_FULL_45_25 TaxID=1802450 RepID=A0A1G2R6J4_9BACT|nr:MAG: transketolase [Candidatus Wildermuthbacteria bacterium RIFCSPHIGHO2_01_FULL_45_20]OHA67872.1 MAG: transketolase [Candidatus Wildermuthbacteria bacterium RIFCSPHIGHO2_02_FULL_45_25]
MNTQYSIEQLEVKANEIRQDIIKMLLAAGSGHSGGPLGMADIFTALYFRVLKHDPKNPSWEDRDRLILSNGHIAPVRYVAMAYAGYFPKTELSTFRQINSRIEGHPSYKRLPGVETSSGPLGEGLSEACGFAFAARLDGHQTDYHIWCLTSDGEHEEGMTWEAAMFAAKYRLNNLTVIIDRNNIQIDGNTEDIMPLEPLREKYESFGWHVIEMNGHDMREIISTLEEAKAVQEKPTCIIAHTIPGKGVSFMEQKYEWHGITPNREQAEQALRELRARA